MKKVKLTIASLAVLFCALLVAQINTESSVTVNKTVYSWESPEGTVLEKGGTAATVMGVDERVNYPNAGNFTLCLSGKKTNLADDPATANSARIVISLDKALVAGDSIFITAYRNKNASGKAGTIHFIYENGTTVNDTQNYVNINNEGGTDYDDDGETPNTIGYEIPEAAAGSKTITLTRNSASTNLFITNFVITRQVTLDADLYAALATLSTKVDLASQFIAHIPEAVDAEAYQTVIDQASALLNSDEATVATVNAMIDSLEAAGKAFTLPLTSALVFAD